MRLIMFDLDGTLVDTVQDITSALNYALRLHGVKILMVKKTKELVGEGVTRLIEKAVPDSKKHLQRDVMERFLEYYSEHLHDNSRDYPHVKETLEKLTPLKKAVISNKKEDLSKRLLEKLNLTRYFDLIVGSDTAGERKPSPIPIRYITSKLSVNPQESVIVGDSEYDIEAGKRAGVSTVAVTYGYGRRDFLRGADYLIDDLRELIPLLQKI